MEWLAFQVERLPFNLISPITHSGISLLPGAASTSCSEFASYLISGQKGRDEENANGWVRQHVAALYCTGLAV